MDVRNCKHCGRLFNYLGGDPICSACRDRIEAKFHDVREYIRANPRATVQQVSDENDVSVSQIRQWVREERLEFSKDSPVGIECENCGASIRTGRFCKNCKDKMKNAFSSAIDKPEPVAATPFQKPKKDNRMRFLQK